MTTGTQTASASRLRVHGMNCGNCARKVTAAAQAVPGVQAVEVDLEAQIASVHWNAPAPNVEGVSEAVQAAGYKVEVLSQDDSGGSADRRSHWFGGLWVGVVGTLPMLLGEWVFRVGAEDWFRWLSFGLGLAVQVMAGARFYRGAWLQLRSFRSNMDTLVSLGSTTAFGYSAWALFAGWPGHLYFMEAAAIITLVSVGHWLEARVSARAAGALRSLLSLTPRRARRLSPAGAEQDVSVAELNADDVVVLKPGDLVPVDGVVEQGTSSVDESMLTGESLPLHKAGGNELYAGTTNLDGRLVMRVTATGESTALAHIIAAVRRAQSSSASIQRLGDRVSSVFVPLVLVVALAAALWWGLAYQQALGVNAALARYLWFMPLPDSALAASFIIGAAVLIIACPCAMGLATPTAIMAAANVAARRGILVRDGAALERAGAVTAVVFDKTGTLTTGTPGVTAEHFVPRPTLPEGPDQLKRLAAGVARHSTHPFSQAIAGLSDKPVEVLEWRELRGAGLIAKTRLEGRDSTIRLGSIRWLLKEPLPEGDGARLIEEWSDRGASVIALSLDKEVVGLFALQDQLKPGAAEVVEALKRGGIDVYMATGDNRPTAISLARQAGIAVDRVLAEVRPEQKADFISSLQERGERVAFVGDGINDAPALEQAHLGVAMGRASDIAREAAAVVLLNSDLAAVPESLDLARATLRTIKQNLFWAFFYNAAAIPLAAFGFLSPILCAVAMGASDLVVIGNALRLRRRVPRV